MFGGRAGPGRCSTSGHARASSRIARLGCSRSSCRRVWRRPPILETPGNVWSYRWPYAADMEVHVTVQPEGESLKLAYNLTNTGSNSLDAVQLHTCLPTTEAPGFFPDLPSARRTNWSELYQRLHLWSGGRSFAFSETCLAATRFIWG